MNKTALAQCWCLDDGTVCLLTFCHPCWDVRVQRRDRVLHVEQMPTVKAAMHAADGLKRRFAAELKATPMTSRPQERRSSPVTVPHAIP